MNRLLLPIVALLIGTMTTDAQNAIFHIDFTDGIPDTISLKDYDGNTPKEGLNYPENTAWCPWTDPDDEYNTMAASCSYYENGKQASDWMILPMLSLPEDSASCQLYWRSRSAYDSFKDGYLVLLSTTKTGKLEDVGDNSWKTLKRISNSENPAQWTSWHINLSEYAGDSVFIAFANITQDGWMLFLDDITVGPRESVAKASVRLTSDLYAANGQGIVKAQVKAGIMDTVRHFNALVTTNIDTLSSEYKNLNILPNSFYELTLKTPLQGIAPETKKYHLTLMENDSVVMAADSSKFIYIMSLAGPKNIVAETVVNSNDGYSLQAIEGYKRMTEKPNFIGLQFHKDDSMTPTNADDYISVLLNDYQITDGRKVLIDRMESGNSYDDMETLYNKRNKEGHLVEAALSGTANDEMALVEMASLLAIPGELADYTYQFILTEDSVWNTQWNLYAGGLFGEFNGYENMDYEIEMPFNDVVRQVYMADSMCFADSIAAGDTIKHSYTFILPQNITEPRQLKMAMIITDNASGEIVNAARCQLEYIGTMEPNAIKEESQNGVVDGLRIDNPVIEYQCDGKATVQVYSLNGVLIAETVGKDCIHTEIQGEENRFLIVRIQEEERVIVKKILFK